MAQIVKALSQNRDKESERMANFFHFKYVYSQILARTKQAFKIRDKKIANYLADIQSECPCQQGLIAFYLML